MPNNIQVTVIDGTTPQAGVRVLYQDDTGNTLDDTMTDATGMATFEVDSANVSVYRTYTGTPARAPEIYTFVGAKAGDMLALGNSTAIGTTPTAIVVQVPTAAQGTVTVTSSCGSGQGQQPNVALTVTNCPSMVDFYVSDGDNNSFFTQVPYSTNIDLSNQVLAQALSSTLAATDVPTNTQVNATERFVDGTFEAFRSSSRRIDQTEAQINVPAIEGVVNRVTVNSINTQNMGQQMIAASIMYEPSPAITDIGMYVIPYVSAASFGATGLTWTETGTGTADAVVAALDVTPKTSTTVTEYWRVVVAPHASSTLALPTLPDAMYNPAATDQVAIQTGILSATGGYDAIRANVFDYDDVVSAAPVDGFATLSYAGNTPPSRVKN